MTLLSDQGVKLELSFALEIVNGFSRRADAQEQKQIFFGLRCLRFFLDLKGPRTAQDTQKEKR
jgi:hypothetical protein